MTRLLVRKKETKDRCKEENITVKSNQTERAMGFTGENKIVVFTIGIRRHLRKAKCKGSSAYRFQSCAYQTVQKRFNMPVTGS